MLTPDGQELCLVFDSFPSVDFHSVTLTQYMFFFKLKVVGKYFISSNSDGLNLLKTYLFIIIYLVLNECICSVCVCVGSTYALYMEDRGQHLKSFFFPSVLIWAQGLNSGG